MDPRRRYEPAQKEWTDDYYDVKEMTPYDAYLIGKPHTLIYLEI